MTSNRPPRPLGAGADLSKIHRRFTRHGTGGLSGRVWFTSLAVLSWLVLTAGDNGPGVVVTTAGEIADALGCCERTVRRALARLEGVGVIDWTRGGILAQRPTPSAVRISKTRLVELTAAGVDRITAVRAARAVDTAERIAEVGRDVDTNRRRVVRSRKSAGRVMRTRANPSAPTEETPARTGAGAGDWRTPRDVRTAQQSTARWADVARAALHAAGLASRAQSWHPL
jgi:hypothetical protein